MTHAERLMYHIWRAAGSPAPAWQSCPSLPSPLPPAPPHSVNSLPLPCSCRHFAAKQISTDMFGMAVGSLVYLSLVPSLVERGRPELVVLAIACAKITLWPFVLSRRAPAFYTRHRDLLLLVQ